MKETLKEIKNLIKNYNFLMDNLYKGDPVTSCMNVYQANIQFDGSLDKLKLRILVRGDLNNKEMIGDTWDQTQSMRTLKYLLAYSVKNKGIIHQMYFIG